MWITRPLNQTPPFPRYNNGMHNQRKELRLAYFNINNHFFKFCPIQRKWPYIEDNHNGGRTKTRFMFYNSINNLFFLRNKKNLLKKSPGRRARTYPDYRLINLIRPDTLLCTDKHMHNRPLSKVDIHNKKMCVHVCREQQGDKREGRERKSWVWYVQRKGGGPFPLISIHDMEKYRHCDDKHTFIKKESNL